MLFTSRLLAVLGFVSASLALPASVPVLKSIPANAAKIAHDVELGVVIAYDASGNILGQVPSSNLRTRDAGTCVTMSSDDVQRLPGWDKIAQYAKDNWGDGWDSVNANPEQYRDSPAILCTGGVNPVTLDADPSCRTQHQTSEGTIIGTTGQITLTADQRTTQHTETTVTQESSLALGTSISATVGIPDIADVTASVTTTLTFTNSITTSNSFDTEGGQSQGLNITNDPGKTCRSSFDVQTCDFTGTGSVRMVGSGWVWFFYGERRNDHYHWAASIDMLEEGDRATYINFRATTSSNSKANYNVNCQFE
ncbi:hypothetical protein BKA62DRAFT_645178 [Auriculariales sp. MPI-PUGE-AT-0066]|nr:hypothetical protein BKA62DRAFT_645178 [Auriculariales sp. MPI-PUGE-AT-0066]